MAFSVFAEQKAAVSHIDVQLLAICVSSIELILADKKISPDERKNKVSEQLKLIQGALEEHARTDESYSALLSKINTAVACKDIPDDIKDIIVSLKLAIYAIRLEKIKNGDIKDGAKTTSQLIYDELKGADRYLKEIGRTDRRFDGLKEKIADAHRSLVPGEISFPLNISEILSELKGEAPQGKKEKEGEKKDEKKKKPDNEFTKPTEMSFEWLAANATYSNIEAYYEKNKDRGWTQEEFEFLYPFLLGKQVIEDKQNDVSYGKYISGGVHDCFDFATDDVPNRCKSENGFSNISFSQLRLREHIPKGWDIVYGGIPPKFPFLSFEEARVFYLRPGDILGTQTSPNTNNTHWAVVGVENGVVTTIGFTGRLQELSIPDFFAHNSKGFDVIRNSPDFDYNEVIRVTVKKTGGSYGFKVEIVPRKEMDKSVEKLDEIGYFVGRD